MKPWLWGAPFAHASVYLLFCWASSFSKLATLCAKRKQTLRVCLALLHLFTLLGPRPPPAGRSASCVLRPPPPSSPSAALSVSALLTRPPQPGENRTGPPRSGRSPITATASKPARRTRPTLRPFSWRVQAVVYVQNFKNITQVPPLLRWLPAAPGGWGGCHTPPRGCRPRPPAAASFHSSGKHPSSTVFITPARFLVLKYVGFFLPLFFLVPLSITLSVTS